MSDEKFILEYEKLLDKGYCDCNEMNCIDNDSPRRILKIAKNLQQENQELKEQLKIKHDGFMASIEEKCELADENQKLKEMQCTFLGTGCQNKMEKYKEVIDKAIKLINKCVEAQLEEDYLMNRVNLMNYNCNLLDILKEVYR